MHKLRHIQSKIGTETAFRIPVSVEDAIAEAVETHDALLAHVERLTDTIVAVRSLPCERSDEGDFMLTKAVLYAPAQSITHIQVKALRDVADKLTFHNIDDCSYYKGYDRAILDVRAAAAALEGEGDDRYRG
jgi:hypothetical protein